MKLRNKICIVCGREDRPHFSKKRCKECASKEYKRPSSKTPISKLSEKRKKEQAIYLKLRLEFLNQHQSCQAMLAGCKIYATDIHHQKGKIGALLNDTAHWIALCRPCHQWAETNPLKAKELGFSKNRLTNEPT